MTSISIFHLNPSTRNTKRRPAFESTVGEGFSTNLALDTQSNKQQSIFTEKEKDARGSRLRETFSICSRLSSMGPCFVDANLLV